MALVQRKISNKKEATLVGALLLVLVITGAVAYIGLFREPASAPRSPSGATSADTGTVPVAPLGKGGLDSLSELSNSPVFQGLKKFGTWPLATEPRGRTEPFTVPFE